MPLVLTCLPGQGIDWMLEQAALMGSGLEQGGVWAKLQAALSCPVLGMVLPVGHPGPSGGWPLSGSLDSHRPALHS